MSGRSEKLVQQQAIVQVAVNCPLRRLFDYLDNELQLQPGDLVQIPFAGRKSVGLVVDCVEQSEFSELKQVQACIAQQHVNAQMLKLLRWCWQYYQHPPGDVMTAAIPKLLRQSPLWQPQGSLLYGLSRAGQALSADSLSRAPRQLELWRLLQDDVVTAVELDLKMDNWRSAWRALLDKDLVEIQSPEAIATVDPQPLQKPGWQLNAQQSQAARSIADQFGQFGCLLLHGITGSGKTAVYVHTVHALLQQQKQCLLLVPEIGLVTQLRRQLQEQLGIDIHCFHSGLTDAQRAETWLAAKSGRAQVIVGTRSAVFLPMLKPGSIVIDEEHDPGYKQFEGFHYHARDVAIKRAADAGIPVVLGTATPALESLHNVEEGKYQALRLTSRFAERSEPRWRVVDCRASHLPGGADSAAVGSINTVLDTQVVTRITETLANDQQVLVYLNRRGYAPLLQCVACGWQADCSQCGQAEQDRPLTWHRRLSQLVCHHCGNTQPAPRLCPACSHPELQDLGMGTEKLADALTRQFDVPVYRVDSDSMRNKDAMQELRDQVLTNRACILVGTQMLSKGHHFPAITLVVAADIDQALFSGDFRATERLAQQLNQVAGRAGRGEQPGEILLQTRQPEHPMIAMLQQADYPALALHLLEQRRSAGLPPFSYQAVLRAESKQAAAVQGLLQKAASIGQQIQGGKGQNTVELLGPVPALMERRAGRYRFQLWLQAGSRAALARFTSTWLPQVVALKQARFVRWQMDVDPQEM